MKAGRWVLVVAASVGGASIARADGNDAPWLAQIGLTKQIQYWAGFGRGVTIGIVDTGVDLADPALAGRISAQSGCAAVTFACSSGAQDDYGHGQFVADVAAGSGIGVAPGATILAEKVIDSSGTGQTTDVANGIVAAANAGAKVINVSLSWQYGDSAVPAAINTAAAAHALTVYAGGNTFGSPMLGYPNLITGFQAPSIAGLTQQSIKDVLFVGSVNANNTLSSFSAVPGNGVLAVATGSVTVEVPLSSVWIVAPGENLPAPGEMGTSYAAPLVSGTAALLDAQWPILVANDATASLLCATATNIGPASTFGCGELDAARAFQPYGALRVPTGARTTVNAAAVSGAFSAGGALGSLTNLANALARAVGFDSFSRDFPLDLGAMVGKKQTSPVLALATQPGATSGDTVHFADGGEVATLVTAWNTPGTYGAPSFPGAPPTRLPGIATGASWMTALTQPDGTTLASGYGFPPAAALTSALWGGSAGTAGAVQALGISTGLLGLAAGGPFTAYGAALDGRQRIAFSMARTAPMASFDTGQSQPSATAAAAGYRVRMSADWSIGVTLASAAEQQGLLGTTYMGSASLGDSHTSGSIGITSTHKLADGFDLVIDGGWSRTDGASLANNLVSNVSGLSAWGAGATLAKADLVTDGDRLSLSLRRPLQVYAGTAGVGIGTVNAVTGATGFETLHVGLAPPAAEADAIVGYAAPLGEGAGWHALGETRENADGIPHNRENLIQLGLDLRF